MSISLKLFLDWGRWFPDVIFITEAILITKKKYPCCSFSVTHRRIILVERGWMSFIFHSERRLFSLGTKWYLSGENVHFIWTGPQMSYPFERQIKPNETQTFCRSLTDCSMCFLFSSRFLLESKSEPWDSWEESRDWLKLSNRSVTSKPKVKTRWLSDPWTAQFW